MAQVTNNIRDRKVEVFTGVRDGVAQMEAIDPGATRDVPIDMENALNKGLEIAGAITVAAAKKPGKSAGDLTPA